MAVTRHSGTLQNSDLPAQFVALDAAVAEEVIRTPADDDELAVALAQLAADRPALTALPLPSDSVRLDLELIIRDPAFDGGDDDQIVDDNDVAPGSVDAPLEEPFQAQIFVVFRDADGLMHRRRLGEATAETGPTRLTVDLVLDDAITVAATAPLSLVDIELRAGVPAVVSRTVFVELVGLDAVDPTGRRTALDTPGWGFARTSFGPLDRPSQIAPAGAAPDALTVAEIETGASRFGALATYGIRPAAVVRPSSYSVVVSRSWFEANDREIGDTIALPGLADLTARIAGTVESFVTVDPSRASVVIIDLPTLQLVNYGLGQPINPIDEAWLGTVGEPAATGRTLEQAPYEATSTLGLDTLADRLLSDPPALGTIGALTLGFVAAAAFAVVGFLVTAIVSARDRAAEFALLRALGLSSRQLAAWTFLEQAALVGLCLVLGTAVGLGLALSRAAGHFVDSGRRRGLSGRRDRAPLDHNRVRPVRRARWIGRVGARHQHRPEATRSRTSPPDGPRVSAVHPRRSWRGGIGVRFWRRRMRAEWVLVVALVMAVMAGTAVLAATPMVFERASELDVRQTVTSAQPEQRNIALGLEARLAPGGDDPLARVAEMGDVYERNSMPESVSPIVSERLFVVDSPTFRATSYPEGREGPFPTTFRFRLQEGIGRESQLVEGALPRPHDPIIELIGPECPPEPYDIAEFTPSDEIDCDLVATPVLETAITRETAADVGVEVGDLMTLTPNLSEVRWQLAGAGDLRMALMVSGIIELSDLSRDYWYADNRLHVPRITENADFRLIAATGLLSPEQYRQLFTDVRRINFEYTWRLLVDPERIDSRTAGEVAADLANVDLGAVDVMTGLPGLVGEYETQRAVVLVLLSTVAFGLALVVASVVASLVMLMSMRQIRTTSLVVARGASRHHLLIDAARTAVALVGPAAAAGWLIAWFTFRSTSPNSSIGVVAAFASIAAATIVAVIMPRAVVDERAVRRVAVEIAVVTATAGGVLAVRRRGAITGEGIAEFDVLLAMTPALIIVSAALITVRLLGPLAHTASWVAERGRGLTIFVGLRQLVVRPAAARTATAAMLVAVGIAVFSASLHSSISRAREASSWYEVGADFTIRGESMGTPLPPAVESLALDLNLMTAQRTTSAGATVRRGRDSWAIDVVAIDAASYASMLDAAPFRPPPFELMTGTGSTADAVAFVSSRWPTGPSPDLDQVLTLDVGTGRLEVTVVAQLDAFPAIAPNRPFVVVDLATVAGGRTESRPTALHVRGEAEVGRQLADRLAADAPHTRLISRRNTLDLIATDPFSRWTVRSLGIVFVLSALFAAVAGSAALGISVVARASEAAVLRTLGVDVRQDGLITAIEHAPAVVLATLGGAVAGVAASWLLRPAVGLSRFSGQRRLVDTSFEIGAILETAALLAVTMVVAVALSMYVRRASDVAATLRVGETP